MSTTDTPACPVPPPAEPAAEADHISRLSDDQSEIWRAAVFGRRRSRFFLMTMQVTGTCAVSVLAVLSTAKNTALAKNPQKRHAPTALAGVDDLLGWGL